MGSMLFKRSDPWNTNYHGLAMAGLIMVLREWKVRRKEDAPQRVTWGYDSDHITLRWPDDEDDLSAADRILSAAFRLTRGGQLDVVGRPGVRDEEGHEMDGIVQHNLMLATFLQHGQHRDFAPGDAKRITYSIPDDPEEREVVYYFKKARWYAHQNIERGRVGVRGESKGLLELRSCEVPGLTAGSCQVKLPWQQVFLLKFVMVGATIFRLRKLGNTDPRYVILFPLVSDPVAFAEAEQHVGLCVPPRHNLTERVFAHEAEALVQFEIHLRQQKGTEAIGVEGCETVVMGRVPWDKRQQIYRKGVYRRIAPLPYTDVYMAAASAAEGESTYRDLKKGGCEIIAGSHVQSLVAANIASGRHWASGFDGMARTDQLFGWILYSEKERLQRMAETLTSPEKDFVEMIHVAWRSYVRGLHKNEKKKGGDANYRTGKRLAKIRQSFKAARGNQNMLCRAIMDFVASANPEHHNRVLQKHGGEIREFMWKLGNRELVESLAQFALGSYTPLKKGDKGKDKKLAQTPS
jgi:CRISPR-associated protein Cas8a1/Csx13